MNWPVEPFSDVLEDVTGGNEKIKQSDYELTGAFPIVDQGQSLIGGYTDDCASLCKTNGPVIIFGDHTKSLKYVDFPFCLGADGTKVLKPKKNADTKYLYYALHNIHIPDAGYSRHFKYLKAGQIPLPPLEEQRRIAGILDQADALRRLRARALDKLNTLGQAIFHEMFGNIGSSKLPTKKFGEFADIRLGKMLDRGKFTGQDTKAYLRNINVRWLDFDLTDLFEMEFSPKEFERFQVKSGDLLICEGGEPGRCAVWQDKEREIYYQKALHRARLDEDIATPNYVAFWFFIAAKTGKLSDFVSTATISHLTGEKIKQLPIMLPSITEQRNFEQRLLALSEQRKFHQVAADEKEALFTSLQHRAFRGEL